MKQVKKKNPVNKESFYDFLKTPNFILNDIIHLIFLQSKLEIYTIAYNEKPALHFPSDSEIFNALLENGFKRLKESKKQRQGLVHGKSHKEYLDGTHNLIKKINSYDVQDSVLMMTAIKYLVVIGENYNQLTDNEKEIFLAYKNALMAKAHEAIGFWKGKLEEKIRNTHGEQGKRNKEAIKNILVEMKIRSLTVFRRDKKLKADFMSRAKEETKKNDKKHNLPLGNKTIMDYARDELAK